MAAQTLPKVQIIDFTKENLKPGTSSWLMASNDARHALEEYGFFVAVYDKISQELDDTAFRALEELFDLPTETKLQNTSDKPFHGYTGQIPHIPIFEGMGIEDATTVEGVESFTRVMWPAGNDHFCETIHSYAKLVSELEQMVNRMVFENYGVEKYHDAFLGSTSYLLRVLKYRVPEMNETTRGTDPHTDKDFITILHQNQVNGLQIEARNGEWINVEYPPSSFVVLAGDIYMAWSNGRVHSARHQVFMSGDKPRYVFGLFSYINGPIQVPEELVDEKHPLQFKPFENFKMIEFYLADTDVARRTMSTAKNYCGIAAV